MASPTPGLQTLRVALDWTPNANHVGFYVAAAKGWYAAAGLRVELLSPAQDGYTRTPAKAALAGEADLAVAPTETAIAYASPQDATAAGDDTAAGDATAPRLVAVAALMQKDTSAVATLASSGRTRPRDLDGATYASYGARYEGGIVRALVRADGGTGAFTEVVPPKLDCFDEVVSGRADATWIFLPHEGVQARRRGLGLHTFALADYGLPYGYTPLLLAPPALLAARGEHVRALLRATADGYAWAAAHPADAADVMVAAAGADHPSLADDPGFVRESVAAAAPAYLHPDTGAWGAMDAGVWERFLSWLGEQGLLTGRDGARLPPSCVPRPGDLFTNAYLPAAPPSKQAQ